MELSVSQRIYYSNHDQIQLSQVAESLLALERIIQRTPSALEQIFDQTKIEKVYVYINKLEAGSLYEDIVVKFFFASQENMDKNILAAREKCGMEALDKKPVLKFVLFSTLLFGGIYAATYFGSTDENKIIIQNQYNYSIKLGSESSGLSEREFRHIIESSISNKANLAKDTTKFIRPAKSDQTASIYFDEENEVFIPSEVIRAIPTSIQDDIADEYLSDYKNVEISIRATDLDSFKRGWAAVIEKVSDRRISLQLDSDIDPETIMGLRTFHGDVTVLFERGGNGDIPKKAFLRGLRNNSIADK